MLLRYKEIFYSYAINISLPHPYWRRRRAGDNTLPQDLALSTIATFFSSITATTLQFTYQETSDALSSATNLFWFISLVFSVSSGVNSLLTIMWRTSHVYVIIFFSLFVPSLSPLRDSLIYSAKRFAPYVVIFWLQKTPMIFMAISAIAFIVGLNLLAYASHQVCLSPSPWTLSNRRIFWLADFCCNYIERVHSISHV